MPNLKDKLQALWDRVIPTKRTTNYNRRYDLESIAHTLDVDRVHSILRAAEHGDTDELFALYRDIVVTDSHLQTEFSKRKLAVLGDNITVMPVDKKLPEDVAAAELAKHLLDSTPGVLDACSHLLDSVLWPVSIVEVVFGPGAPGKYQWGIAEMVPLPYQLLDFTDGTLRIYDSDPVNGHRMGSSQLPDSRYLIHRGHLLTTPDYWGGPMRSLVFWWLLATMDRDWWARFLERYGAPFIVAKYNQGDDSARSILEVALSAATRLFGVVVSTDTHLELIQASTQSAGEAFEKFHSIAQREKSKLVLGQTLSSEAQSTGLGSGVSSSQEAVRADIRQFDAMRLGTTLRDRLIAPWMRANQIPGQTPRILWSRDDVAMAQSTGDLLASLANAGLEVDDEAIGGVSERIGIQLRRKSTPAPAPGPMALPFSAALDPNPSADAIDEAGSADLAQAFRGALAPVRRIIRESQTPAEVEERIRVYFADWSAARIAGILDQALTAHAANGARMAARR